MSFITKGIILLVLIFGILNVYAQEPENDVPLDSLILKSRQTSFDANTMKVLPFRTAGSVVLAGPNSYFLKGDAYYLDGLEAGESCMFIDGMQVKDGNDFLFRSIFNYNYYRSNQPISMGNVAGGLVEIKTRTFSDSICVEGEVYNAFEKGYKNLFYELLVGGPISFNKKENRKWKKRPSFFISAGVNRTNDPDPSWEDKYMATPDYQGFLTQNPYRESGLSFGGTTLNSEFSEPDDFNRVNYHQDAGRKMQNVFAKIDIPVNENMDLTIGSYFKNDIGKEFLYENALFNSHNNPQTVSRNVDNYLNWKHTFIKSDDLTASYNVHFQYSNYYYNRQSETHEDRWFEYGYLGKYKTYKSPSFELGDIEINGIWYEDVEILNSWDWDTAYTFQNMGYNNESARFTEIIYEIFPEKGGLNDPIGNWRNQDDLVLQGGLLNGMDPYGPYGLWNSQGNKNNTYFSATSIIAFGETRKEHIRSVLNLDLQFKKHKALVGFEYSKRIERSYAINPMRLWSAMRGFTNFHILNLDLDNPYFNGEKVYFKRLFSSDEQFDFDYNLRQKLGLATDGLDYILIDSYDMQNNTIDYYDKDGIMHTINTPDNLLDIDLFDPSTLIQSGIVSYKGYTADGSKYKSNNDPYSFYSNRTSEAFSPVYTSVFVEDNFAYGNFSARVGLRMDYYNANQPEMKDAYSLYEIYTKSEVAELEGNNINMPSSIGDDFAVYVDNVYQPTHIMGYRDGDKWYNTEGSEISDPNILDAGSGISPYLKYPGVDITSEEWQPDMSFKDYKPVYNFLPQINLNYHFWKMNVYGNYNSFTKNPYYMNTFRPENYSMMWAISVQENPSLKPYRIDKLNLGANINIYKGFFIDFSIQSMVLQNYFVYQLLYGAYPRTYTTLINFDEVIGVGSATLLFSFIPSKSFGWSGNISLTSSSIDEEYREIINISDFVMNANINYDFGSGKSFRYPNNNLMKIIFDGFNIGLFYQSRSGTYLPRTREEVQNYDYSPNFSFFNLRAEKGFYIKSAGLYLGAYVWIENLFNQKNVYYVDPTTGIVNDDGYLSSPEWQNEINSQTKPDSYRWLYSIKQNNPTYYAKPQIVRVGLIAKF